MASAIPRLPLDHATALQHRGHSAGEDSDVMLRGHTWLRRAARLMIAALGSPRTRALQGYMLQAASTSAEPPILYGRLRLMAGQLPEGTQGDRIFIPTFPRHKNAALHLLSAPLTIPLVCCHIKSFQRASSCSEAMARRRKEERRAGLA
jgi:hypothetical protein